MNCKLHFSSHVSQEVKLLEYTFIQWWRTKVQTVVSAAGEDVHSSDNKTEVNAKEQHVYPQIKYF